MMNKPSSCEPATSGFEPVSSASADVCDNINARLAEKGWSLLEFKRELEKVDMWLSGELMTIWINELVDNTPAGVAHRYARMRGDEAIAVTCALIASGGIPNEPTAANAGGDQQDLMPMIRAPGAKRFP